ncbi:MAG: PIN domain-containing protein [Caldilineaceae bacterium]
MKAYILDTHMLWWYLSGKMRKLSHAARQAFEEGERGEAILYLPIIVLFELWDANQRSGLPLDFPRTIQAIHQAAQFVIVPLDEDDIDAYDQLAAIPEGRDRMIATATIKMDAPLLTVDQEIIASCAVQVLQ